MLRELSVTTTQGETLTLPLADSSNGFEVRDIEGLDPVESPIVSSSFALKDGTDFQSTRRDQRNIVIKLGLEPNWGVTDVEGLRKQLYRFFMPKSSVTLRFVTGEAFPVRIKGRVESFVNPFFSEDPEVTISVICFDPDFISASGIGWSQLTTTDLTEQTLTYEGTVETGIDIQISFTAPETGFTLYHRTPNDEQFALEFAANTLAGDKVRIDTRPGFKGAWLERAGVVTSILYGVSPAAKWIALQPGNNYLRMQKAGAARPYTISYNNRYGGL